jgi:hypothetical protein
MQDDHPVSVVPNIQFLIDSTPVVVPRATSTAASLVSSSVAPASASASAVLGSVSASHAIRVMLYSGEFDLNCNTLGTLHTLEANKWRNRHWSSADRSLWKVGDDVAGELRVAPIVGLVVVFYSCVCFCVYCRVVCEGLDL